MLQQELLPKSVAILGTGRSGVATIRFFDKYKIPLFVSDSAPVQKVQGILEQNNLSHVAFEGGGHSDKIFNYELIVCSPGIPSDIPILQKARQKGIPVLAEVELAFKYSEAPYIAVTGSTGKSTTVSLIGAALEGAHYESVVAGNIGIPLIETAPKISENGIVVAEISSFQLENIETFRPRVSVVLNLMKNHLDRYDSEEDYYLAKKRIFENATNEDYAVLNAHDDRLCQWGEELESQCNVVYYGDNVSGKKSVWVEDSQIMTSFFGETLSILDVSKMKLRGKHNYENCCAAVASLLAMGLDYKKIVNGLLSFTGLKHRLEYVRTLSGVEFYNDSKATTAESIYCAVDAFDNGVRLIAGGKDKGCAFEAIKKIIKEKVESVYLIGEATDRITTEWNDSCTIIKCSTLSEAVEKAYIDAQEGDAVVLSPGCSSFDMFKGFEDRGEQFCTIVHYLLEKGYLS